MNLSDAVAVLSIVSRSYQYEAPRFPAWKKIRYDKKNSLTFRDLTFFALYSCKADYRLNDELYYIRKREHAKKFELVCIIRADILLCTMIFLGSTRKRRQCLLTKNKLLVVINQKLNVLPIEKTY